MIKINPYYRTDEDLNKAEEPFMSITYILERLYLDGVNGKKDVSYKFKNTYAVSCMSRPRKSRLQKSSPA